MEETERINLLRTLWKVTEAKRSERHKLDGALTPGNQEQSRRRASRALGGGWFHPGPEVVLLPAQKLRPLDNQSPPLRLRGCRPVESQASRGQRLSVNKTSRAGKPHTSC